MTPKYITNLIQALTQGGRWEQTHHRPPPPPPPPAPPSSPLFRANYFKILHILAPNHFTPLILAPISAFS